MRRPGLRHVPGRREADRRRVARRARVGLEWLEGRRLLALFTEFTVPTPGAAPRFLTTGPDGNIWIDEYNAGKIARMTTAGDFTEFTIPTSTPGPHDIIVGPDGDLWFSEGVASKIGKITTSGAITEFTLPDANAVPECLTVGPDGNLWCAANLSNKIYRITPAGDITGFLVPTPNSRPSGIATGPDGNIWFTEFTGSKVGRITTSGVITEYTLPTANSEPWEMIRGPDDNYWFSEANNDAIGRITPAGVLTEFPVLDANSQPWAISNGPDGAIWFTETNYNLLARMTTDGVITAEYPVPSAKSWPFGLITGPDGNLWLTENKTDIVARFEIPTRVAATASTRNASGAAVTFAVAASDRSLWENDPDFSSTGTGNWEQVSPAAFASISATTDVAGDPVVFGILASDGSLWENDRAFAPSSPDLNGQWQLVSPASFRSISATKNAAGDPVVFGILSADGSLWENDRAFAPSSPDLNGQWLEASPASFASVAATRNSSGAPVAFGVLSGDGSLWENDRDFNASATGLNGQWGLVSPAAFASIAATTNEVGDPVVFGVLSAGGALWENDRSFNPSAHELNGQWLEISPGSFGSIAATTNASGEPVVFATIRSDGSLWENDRDFNPTAADPNTQWRPVSPTAFASISAAANATGDPVVFGVVVADAALWENDRALNPDATDLNAQWMILPDFGGSPPA